MSQSKNLYKDIVTGLFFTVGVISVITGEFIISSILFCAAAVSSNLNANPSLRA